MLSLRLLRKTVTILSLKQYVLLTKVESSLMATGSLFVILFKQFLLINAKNGFEAS